MANLLSPPPKKKKSVKRHFKQLSFYALRSNVNSCPQPKFVRYPRNSFPSKNVAGYVLVW